MSLEQTLRTRIASYHFSAPERSVLKVVLGELQQKGDATDEVGFTVIKKMIKSNEENLGYLAETDHRRAQYLLENEVLGSLLPKYLSAAEIRKALDEGGVDVKSPQSDGQATGKAMQFLKGLNVPVEGGIVKEVVAEMRKN